MTNEEAIEILQTAEFPEDYTVEEIQQALDIIIRALKNEQSQVEKQVKDLEEMGKWFLEGVIEGFNEQTEQNVGMCQQNVGEMSEKQTGGDLISRQSVNKLRKYNLVGGIHTVSLDDINKLPSAKTTINSEKTTITDGDLISRKAVKDLIRDLTRWCVRSQDGKFNNVGLLYDDVMFGIDRLPSEENTAEWVDMGFKEEEYGEFGKCSNCGVETLLGSNYCPNCGCRMKGVE